MMEHPTPSDSAGAGERPDRHQALSRHRRAELPDPDGAGRWKRPRPRWRRPASPAARHSRLCRGEPSSRFGRVKNYHHRAHEELCVLVQIETAKGSTISKPSPRCRASTGCSSGRATSPRTWAISATRPTRSSSSYLIEKTIYRIRTSATAPAFSPATRRGAPLHGGGLRLHRGRHRHRHAGAHHRGASRRSTRAERLSASSWPDPGSRL